MYIIYTSKYIVIYFAAQENESTAVVLAMVIAALCSRDDETRLDPGLWALDGGEGLTAQLKVDLPPAKVVDHDDVMPEGRARGTMAMLMLMCGRHSRGSNVGVNITF